MQLNFLGIILRTLESDFGERILPYLKAVLGELAFPLNSWGAELGCGVDDGARNNTKNLLSAETAPSVDGKMVHFLLADESSDDVALPAPETSKTLCIMDLPKLLTIKMLLPMLAPSCQPVPRKLDKRPHSYFNEQTVSSGDA
ncbi:hypothetical protein CSKR_101356 [Clonorchis sinensis]|uniref:Uncharacterized protein n=1 Tax=Clonorchis sinensis TaxID=79923 RepID=A0A3R7DNF3_CLOSI|nr:hypothetical protein CSKR_101356 [Clonorchis sinensis]